MIFDLAFDCESMLGFCVHRTRVANSEVSPRSGERHEPGYRTC
ncbi:hypothetical protein FM113_04750 [Leucobacter sp. 7(1)]|nr:hypothetical protein FM113_04750 [Leucobacter sp. 7(1)]